MKAGERMLMLRTLTGESQNELGNLIKSSQRMVSDYHSSDTLPDRICINLSKIYHVNKQWLRTGEGNVLKEPFVVFNTLFSQEIVVRNRAIKTAKLVLDNQFREFLSDYVVNVMRTEVSNNIIILELDADEPQHMMINTPLVNTIAIIAEDLNIPISVIDKKSFKKFGKNGVSVAGGNLKKEKGEALTKILQLMRDFNITIKDIEEAL